MRAFSSWAAAIALLVLLPSATACSLAYMPYDRATWEDSLHYLEGDQLRRVDSGLDRVVEEGYFLSYATAGDLLLVGGQTGLGADCTGAGWLRLHAGATKVWEKAGRGMVWPDADGPIAVYDGKAWRLEGRDLLPLEAVVPDGYVLGWTPEALPVYRSGSALVVGSLSIPRPDVSGFEPAVARNAEASGLAFHTDGKLTLLEVTGNDAKSRSWSTAQDRVAIAWANAWYVLSGGRVFLVGDDVVDLGLAGAVAMGARGTDIVAFTEQGYTVFRGTRAIEAARHAQGAWLPVPVPAGVSPKAVEATEWEDLEGETQTSSNTTRQARDCPSRPSLRHCSWHGDEGDGPMRGSRAALPSATFICPGN